jgi:hypothetical protein
MTSRDSKIRSTRLVSVAMTEAGTKQTRAKSVSVEKVKRRAVIRPTRVPRPASEGQELGSNGSSI